MKRVHPVRDLIKVASIIGLFLTLFFTSCDIPQTQTNVEERLVELEAMITDTANMGSDKHREKFYKEVANLQTLDLTDKQAETLNQLQYTFLQTDYLICHSNVDNTEEFPNIMWFYEEWIKDPASKETLEDLYYIVLTTPADGDRYISGKTVTGKDPEKTCGNGNMTSFVKIPLVISYFMENNATLTFKKSVVYLNYTNDKEKGNISIVFLDGACSNIEWTITNERGEINHRLSYRTPPKENEMTSFENSFKNILTNNTLGYESAK